ncbi:hypothetical protein E2C01_068670 [Portunus trituberculatus]|uniref:Uncharacterized protein n=1 Tax=Portunus trituberculatus TaxID=210409 RepID=A0A5B7HWI8_PORTR|nr:hypothetical protein [Portunus trituberculatus]
MLQEAPLAAVAVAWRVWWAAGIDMVLCTTTKGERSALRRQLDKITEDITFLLGAMGRGQQRKEEEELDQEEREKGKLAKSNRKSKKGCLECQSQCRSERVNQKKGIEAFLLNEVMS